MFLKRVSLYAVFKYSVWLWWPLLFFVHSLVVGSARVALFGSRVSFPFGWFDFCFSLALVDRSRWRPTAAPFPTERQSSMEQRLFIGTSPHRIGCVSNYQTFARQEKKIILIVNKIDPCGPWSVDTPADRLLFLVKGFHNETKQLHRLAQLFLSVMHRLDIERMRGTRSVIDDCPFHRLSTLSFFGRSDAGKRRRSGRRGRLFIGRRRGDF